MFQMLFNEYFQMLIGVSGVWYNAFQNTNTKNIDYYYRVT